MGEGRWHKNNGRRFPIMVGVAMVLGYGSVKLAQRFPGTPVGLVVGIVIVICFIFAYQRYIHSPAKKAGEEFLAAKPITPFYRIKKNDDR
jgi:hypothetical protein